MDEKNKVHKDLSDFYGKYKSNCPCGITYELYSQKEFFYCEYVHDVFIECPKCHGLAKFEISVN